MTESETWKEIKAKEIQAWCDIKTSEVNTKERFLLPVIRTETLKPFVEKLEKENAELKQQLKEVRNCPMDYEANCHVIEKYDVLVQKINEERKWLVDTYSTNENLRCVKECWDDFEGAIEKHDELFAEVLQPISDGEHRNFRPEKGIPTLNSAVLSDGTCKKYLGKNKELGK